MPRPLIAPRGVFVPSEVIYNESIADTMKSTYMQLLGLAYGRSETPPLSFQQLSEITNKTIGTLYKHMGALRDRGALRWRTAQDGTIIVSFPKDVAKGQAFFSNEKADSENREKPVKEDEEDTIHPTRKDFDPPPTSVNGRAKKQKENLLSPTMRQALLDGGVFESKLPELAQVGLSDNEITAILNKVQDEFDGEKKGGIVVHRIQNKVLPPQEYFAEACSFCGKYGNHAPNCSQGLREKYLWADSDVEDCICHDKEEVSLSAPITSSLNTDIQEVWQVVLDQLQLQLPRASYNTWFRDTQALRLDGNTLVVTVHDDHTREICESRLKKTVSNLLIGILNTADTDVKFVVMEPV